MFQFSDIDIISCINFRVWSSIGRRSVSLWRENLNVEGKKFEIITGRILFTNRKTNRLEESKNIFDTIVNNTTFKGISIILFLNKTDLLAIKVRNPETDIRQFYPNFIGNPHSILDVQNFILQMFMSTRRNTHTTIYHHFTNAVDTQNIQVVFNSVKDTILKRNLSALMLQ